MASPKTLVKGNWPQTDEEPPKPTGRDEAEVARWRDRWRVADRRYKKWERQFQCKRGWEWYEGFQGADAHLSNDPAQDPYVVNLIYPTVEVKIPSMYFRSPKGVVLPRPMREDDPVTTLQERARLREDMLNTYVLNPRFLFKPTTNLALKESFFYFGMVEVGCSADYISNPNAGRPVLDGDTPLRDSSGEDVVEPPIIPTNEEVYVRRIPACQFRVSARSSFYLEHADWSGYFAWVYAEDVKKDPATDPYAKTEVKATGQYDQDYTGETDLFGDDSPGVEGYMSTRETESKTGMLKVLKIWDHRAKVKFIIPNNGNYYIQRPVPWKVFPFSPLSYHPRENGFYPMPPHFNWLSLQAELNDTREMQRLHRKRMVRRFQRQAGSVTPTEMEKLETGGDGTIIETNVPVPAIIPIEDAPLDSSVVRNVPQTKEDFMEVTATGSDQRQGNAADETATQATIIETRSRIRESFGQEIIADWIEDIFTKILLTIQEHVTLPEWIMRNIDPLSPTAMMESLKTAGIWQQIQAEELGELSFDVMVAAESLSPVNEDVQNQRLLEWMNTVSANPILMLMLRSSDDLLRRALQMIGMRNEKTVQQVKLALEVALLASTGGMSAQLPSDQGQSGQNAQEVAMSTGQAPGGGLMAPGAAPPAGGGGAPGVNQLRAQMGIPG